MNSTSQCETCTEVLITEQAVTHHYVLVEMRVEVENNATVITQVDAEPWKKEKNLR